MLSTDSISIIMPAFNAEKTITRAIESIQKQTYKNWQLIIVNDGSKDRTWSIIQELHEQNPMFSGVNLSRNRGHQNALLAGLMTAKECADMVISMDADLQDDMVSLMTCCESITMEMILYMEREVSVRQIPFSNVLQQKASTN